MKDDELLVVAALAQGEDSGRGGQDRRLRCSDRADSGMREEDFAGVARRGGSRQVTSAAAAQLAGLYPKAIGALSDLLDDRSRSDYAVVSWSLEGGPAQGTYRFRATTARNRRKRPKRFVMRQ